MVDSDGEQHHWLFGAAGNNALAGVEPTVHARLFFHNFCEYAVKMSIHPHAGTAPTRFALRCSSRMAGVTLRWDCSNLVVDPSRNCWSAGAAAGARQVMGVASVSARRPPGARRRSR
jgi:hypothetical protein